MIYLGVDPGKKGGIAIINEYTGTYSTVPYSDDALKRCMGDVGEQIFAEKREAICCLEKVGAMPHQGVTSMFNFGVSYGFIKGILEICGIPYQEIPPQRWKKEFGLNNDKMKSIEVCKRLFPAVNLLPTERSRVDNDGMAEALLMAEYARRKL